MFGCARGGAQHGPAADTRSGERLKFRSVFALPHRGSLTEFGSGDASKTVPSGVTFLFGGVFVSEPNDTFGHIVAVIVVLL